MTKQDVINKIKEYIIPKDYLVSIDKDLYSYVKYNLEVPEEHNKYEILGVLRFLDFLKREDLEFRIKEVKRFYVFYKSLKFESPKGMRHFELTPVQKFQVANILGFYIKGTEYRLCRDALLFVPRKFAKSTMTSSFAIYALLFRCSRFTKLYCIYIIQSITNYVFHHKTYFTRTRPKIK